MATIRKRENDKFISYEAQVRKKGHGILTKTFRNRADAEKWSKGVEVEIDRGIFVNRTEAENTTLYEALGRYLIEVTPHKKGAKRETSRIKSWQKHHLAKRVMSSIKGKDIATFRDLGWKRGLADNTIKLDISLLSVVFDTAIKEWGMESIVNPCRLIKMPGGSKQRERRLETFEEEFLIKGILAGSRNQFIVPIIKFALETATRQSEAINLMWQDVNFKKSTAILRDTKNGDDRTVPLSPQAIHLLNNMPRNISGRVFKITQDGLIRAFSRGCIRGAAIFQSDYGTLDNPEFLKNLTFHDLRHEATSRLFESRKFDMMEIASITGHKTLNMLKRYTHLRAEDLAKRMHS